jgi:hypothetical protein
MTNGSTAKRRKTAFATAEDKSGEYPHHQNSCHYAVLRSVKTGALMANELQTKRNMRDTTQYCVVSRSQLQAHQALRSFSAPGRANSHAAAKFSIPGIHGPLSSLFLFFYYNYKFMFLGCSEVRNPLETRRLAHDTTQYCVVSQVSGASVTCCGATVVP